MSGETTRRFEDFAVGEVLDLGSRTVSRDEIVAFAAKWDPQPMHLDEEAGRASLAGGLIASGWHTASLFMRMACDTVLARSASLGSPGIDKLSWRAPLRPGDTLSGTMRITDARASTGRPELGFLGCEIELKNQRDETVLTMRTTLMMGRRAKP
ncbi:MAG: MaoC family dehydratase [Siculibacillus sp.]|nr:MaoC family dehydratase [Siculibacillus sp.]